MKEGQPFNFVEVASQYVDDEILRPQFEEAFAKIDAIQHGEGCQCPNCLKSAVSEVNSYLNMLDPDGKYPRYHTDSTYIWTEESE